MAAWGKGIFENDLAVGLLQNILDDKVYPIILEAPKFNEDWDLQTLKHQRAFYYDRLVAASELMKTFKNLGVHVPKGYFNIAKKRIEAIERDHDWLKSWSNGNTKKIDNYLGVIVEQGQMMTYLRDISDD